MAGWRVGFAAGNERLIAALARVKSYLDYGAFTPVQVAAAAALNGPQDCVDEMREIYRARRNAMVESFTRAGWEIPEPKASMFAWAPIPEPFREAGSLEFSLRLIKEAHVAVAPGAGFGEHGDGYVRLALVENEQRIRQAARNIRKFLEANGVKAKPEKPKRQGRRHADTSQEGRRMTAPKGSKTLRLGVAGLGTVGGGLLKLIERQDELRLPGRLVVTAVSARSKIAQPRRRHLETALGRRSGRTRRRPTMSTSSSN